ncbi:hypothetical protein [Streptomyces sp. NBC_01198]|uniref:hypothetical protein n=1 Tax=Streptomyces sp. NBC_01198 TaxID=2903769 RepID=UPI002E16092D|nr:hypothetical protein OG702_19075 [Streptomyces sp. NBC_01198]
MTARQWWHTERRARSMARGVVHCVGFGARRRPRLASAALVAGAVAALLAVPAGAGAAVPAGGIPDLPGVPADVSGLVGPLVTHPAQEPVDYPAGEVCAFAAHADFPVSDLTTRTWTDAAGTPVFAIESGPLVMKVTNLATGKSVERDISGSGVVTYPDPDSFVLSGNDWSAGFHTGDHPHNRWIVASTYMSVKISTVAGTTSRRLLVLAGPYEDLCATLA